MTFMIMMVYLVIYCIQGAIWGWAVNKVIENKGYRENWFWWGFFFGLLALIVALTKPDVPRTTDETGSYFGEGGSVVGRDYVFRGFGNERKTTDVPAGWRCTHCGQVNAGYVGTCGCGWSKSGDAPTKGSGQKKEEQPVPPQKEEKPVPQPAKMLYCTSCGKQMEADSKFCRYCGTKA